MNGASRTEFEQQLTACVSGLRSEPHAALARLFDLTAERLVRYALAITRKQEDAEDAYQSALTRIASKPKLLAKAHSPWPYLVRAVRNEALKILQKRRTSSLENSPTPICDPEELAVLQKNETAARVRQILKQLPESQYEVVILKHWEELTFAEIAEVLEKSQNTVASRYRYAMEKLQVTLEPLVKEGID